MLLSVDILSENLSEVIPLKKHGHSPTKLRLKRPLLHDGTSTFKVDNVYITSSDSLPKQPNLEAGTVIICKGQELPKSYFSDKCVLLLLDTSLHITSIFNAVQKIFDKYGEWDRKLQQIMMDRGRLSSLLDVSRDIFGNPIFIIAKDLGVIAKSTLYDEIPEEKRQFPIESETALKSLLDYKNAYRKKNVYLYDMFDTNMMCINLFKESKFIGGIYIKENIIRPFKTSDKGLLLHLKTYVDFLSNQYDEILSVDNNLKKSILLKILAGDILNDTRLLKEIRLNQNKQDKYICIKFKLDDSSKVISTKQACEQIEEILPGTIAVVFENTLVALTNIRLSPSNPIAKSPLLISFLQEMGYKAGLSEEFTDIFNAKYYFREACAAIDLGYPLNPDLEVYYFEDYIKEYILSMITSEIPAEMICEKGLLDLLDYDALHNTNYYEELRTYINCNMNAVQTAKKLFIHRNTLLTHLDHINELVEIDLNDPDKYLHIQLSFKLLDSEGI